MQAHNGADPLTSVSLNHLWQMNWPSLSRAREAGTVPCTSQKQPTLFNDAFTCSILTLSFHGQ